MRRERLASLEASRTEPQVLAQRALVRTLAPYPADDVRYNATIEEQIERMQNVKHEQVQALYRDFLGVATAEISLVGDFDKEPCLALLKETFAGWKPKQPFERIARPVVELVEGKKHEIDTPDKANAVYSAGMLIPISDEHRIIRLWSWATLFWGAAPSPRAWAIACGRRKDSPTASAPTSSPRHRMTAPT